MQSVSVGTMLLVSGFVIVSIIMIWLSSTLILVRKRVNGGIHVFCLGCITALNAGIIFYDAVGTRNVIAIAEITIFIALASWVYEAKLRSVERKKGDFV